MKKQFAVFGLGSFGESSALELQKLGCGTRNLDAVVIAEAESLEASIMAALECKEIGVPNVIAKAKNNRHATVLKKIGVDTIIFPEKEMGVRLAKNLMSASFTDWIAG